eukprot:3847437-Rhodomonas_salina.3
MPLRVSANHYALRCASAYLLQHADTHRSIPARVADTRADVGFERAAVPMVPRPLACFYETYGTELRYTAMKRAVLSYVVSGTELVYDATRCPYSTAVRQYER